MVIDIQPGKCLSPYAYYHDDTPPCRSAIRVYQGYVSRRPPDVIRTVIGRQQQRRATAEADIRSRVSQSCYFIQLLIMPMGFSALYAALSGIYIYLPILAAISPYGV